MFCAKYGARPKLVWERRPWNVRRSSKPFLDGRPPLGQVCCISMEHLLYSQFVCMVSLRWPSWTSLELGDYHAPSTSFWYSILWKLSSNVELNFAKVYEIQYKVELEFQKIEFHICHISLNCIELDFGDINFYFELDFKKIEFQKMLYNKISCNRNFLTKQFA